jgi:hypothetical protein
MSDAMGEQMKRLNDQLGMLQANLGAGGASDRDRGRRPPDADWDQALTLRYVAPYHVWTYAATLLALDRSHQPHAGAPMGVAPSTQAVQTAAPSFGGAS